MWFLLLFFAVFPYVSMRCDVDDVNSHFKFVCIYANFAYSECVRNIWCTNSSLDEMYLVNQVNILKGIQNAFFVSNSSFGSLTADDKLWVGVFQLTLNDTGVSQISSGFFNGLSNLTKLSMTHNNISFLEDGVFQSLTNLTHLNLSYNAIERLGPSVFLGLSNLKVLDLRRNKIFELPANLTLILPKLTFLNISDNYFVHFGMASDSSRTIDVSSNNISTIENFGNFTAFEVNLSFNRLRKLSRVGNIEQVTITHNQLDILGDNFVSPKVKRLDLSFNAIRNVSPTCFLESEQLSILNLSHNKIEQLSPRTFFKLWFLERLDLSDNNIAYFEFGIFDNQYHLHYLNVSSNGGLVDFHALSRLQQLWVLDFEGNEFKNFDESFFKTHPHLTIRMSYEKIQDCKNLMKFIQLMESYQIRVSRGTYEGGTRIHGLECKISNSSDISEEPQNIIGNNTFKFNESNPVYKEVPSCGGSTLFININLVVMNIILLLILMAILWRMRKWNLRRPKGNMEMIENFVW